MIDADCQFGNDAISRRQLNYLEDALDNLFAAINIDIEFTKHFFDRVNDKRNKAQITLCELADLFKALYRKYNLHLADLSSNHKEIEEMVKSITSNINIPFVMKWDKRNNELDLIAKTVMRKKDFRTRTKVLKVESFKEFIKERWMKSGKTMYNSDMKIFINPTRKELLEMGSGDVRGLAAPNGKAYVGSTGIHPDIADLIEDEVDPTTTVPFLIDDAFNKSAKIEFGDYIYGTKYKNNYEAAKKILEKNMWIKKMFPKADITGELY